MKLLGKLRVSKPAALGLLATLFATLCTIVDTDISIKEAVNKELDERGLKAPIDADFEEIDDDLEI